MRRARSGRGCRGRDLQHDAGSEGDADAERRRRRPRRKRRPKPEAIAARLKTDGTPEAAEAAEAVAGETGA
jgi:hypothetical protein